MITGRDASKINIANNVEAKHDMLEMIFICITYKLLTHY